ncbi:hypothetical protein JCM19046_2239 [Bacillus sp. JCM 19046]|nr:hypothetical protein JCM19046_2239 [Bacillus sp. JCM 19046]
MRKKDIIILSDFNSMDVMNSVHTLRQMGNQVQVIELETIQQARSFQEVSK